MEFLVRIDQQGIRTHEVITREDNENCQMIRQFDSGIVVSDEQTGPDCSEVHEKQV